MRWNSFGGSLVFALAAAAALPAVWLGLGPLVGQQAALGGYLIAVAVLYVCGLGIERPRRWRVSVAASLAGAFCFALAGGITQLALCAALLVAIGRGWLFGARPLRAAAIEVGLAASGLLLAKLMLGPGVLSLALALWAYLLVQSAFFLIGGVAGPPAEGSQDGFARARDRLLRLLEEDPV